MENKKTVQYIKNGRIVDEKVECCWVLTFLYTTWIGRLVRILIIHRWVGNLYGRLQDSWLSCYKIVPFIKKHKIDMRDFERPAGGYRSFNDFFIRKIKPGKRVIDMRAGVVVSPADSKLFVVPSINQSIKFFVKALPFNLERFLCNRQLAQEYTGGTLLIFRLAPQDYHRFHFPADGVVQAPIIISGHFDSVNPLVYKNGMMPLLTNERHIIKFQTQQFGTMLIIPVGALMVGKIVGTYTHNQSVKKGDEAGYFAFGGSTVVLLVKPGIAQIQEPFIENSVRGFETVVKMGQAITF